MSCDGLVLVCRFCLKRCVRISLVMSEVIKCGCRSPDRRT